MNGFLDSFGFGQPAHSGALQQQPMNIIPQPMQPPAQQPRGFLDGTQNWLQSNPQAIWGLASGLLSGNGTRDALARGFAGYGQGAPLDRAEGEKQKRNRELTALLKVKAAGGAITPEMYQAAGLGDQYAERMLFKEEPAFRQMTDPEKQAWGIQGGSWAMGKDNKPVQIQDDRLLTPEQMAQKKELAKAGSSSVNVDMGGKLTEGQSKDIGFYSRGRNADIELAPLENQLTNLGGATAGQLGTLGNYAKSTEYQQAERAGREFLAVILRKDTGAAVTPAEFALYGPMYLPVPGDAPEVIAAKKTARAGALKAMKLGLGTARPLAEQIDEELKTQAPAAPAVAPRTIGQPQQQTTPGKPPAVYQWTPDAGLRPAQ